jgi:triacylglycerol lipase
MTKQRGKYFVCILLLLLPLFVFGNQKIFLLHCYFCPKMVMDRIERSCRREHFITENYAYKSITENLDTLGKELYLNIKNSGFDTVSFVTHSMGALVVRSMLRYSQDDESFPFVYRIVMIAPPNHGSEMADFGSSIGFLKDVVGPNVSLMKTDSGSFVNQLPVPDRSEVGIIIGSLGEKHGYNPFIKGDNDGLVTPNEAKLGIEKDIAKVRGFHGLLPNQKIVRKQVIEFLKKGRFLKKNKG